jgi:transcriptional regulator with XRE-family HTH domain
MSTSEVFVSPTTIRDTSGWRVSGSDFRLVLVDEERVTNYRAELGRALRRSRKKLSKHTQASIAKVLGVNMETVGRWERGLTDPTASQLHVMAAEYEVWNDAGLFLFPPGTAAELNVRVDRLAIERAAHQAATEAASAASLAAMLRRLEADRLSPPDTEPGHTTDESDQGSADQ